MKRSPPAFKPLVSGIPDMIHEAGCRDCDWALDEDGVYGQGEAVLKEAKRHVAETGHCAWKHSIRLFSIEPE